MGVDGFEVLVSGVLVPIHLVVVVLMVVGVVVGSGTQIISK